MKKKIKTILIVLSVIAISSFIIYEANTRLISQATYEKYYDFYRKDFSNYDVLFLGSSRMELAVSPIELWKYTGLMSYNLSDYGQQIPVNYWVLADALTRTNPQLVVVDTTFVSSDDKEGGPNVNHECLDLMPFSLTKIKAINDLFPPEDRFEYYFNFSYYHSRWNEISHDFWNEHRSFQKGGNIYSDHNVKDIVFSEQTPYPLPDISERILIETISKEYLRRMISLCQEKEIDVCLINCPSYRGVELQKWFDSVNDIAKDYNVKYFDFNRKETNINPLTDFRDEGHLDNSGARKFTKLLGNLLIEEYGLDCSHTESENALWQNDYREYMRFKISQISDIDSLPTYLMTLKDEDLDVIIEANSLESLQDSQVSNMLKNLGLDVLPSEKSFILINKGTTASVFSSKESSILIDTEIGAFKKESLDDDPSYAYSVSLNDNKLYSIETNAKDNEVTRIVVLDSHTHEKLDYAIFTFENSNMMNRYGDQ